MLYGYCVDDLHIQSMHTYSSSSSSKKNLVYFLQILAELHLYEFEADQLMKAKTKELLGDN